MIGFSVSSARADSCENLALGQEQLIAKIRELSGAEAEYAERSSILGRYLAWVEGNPEAAKAFPREEVIRLLAEPVNDLYASALDRIVTSGAKQPLEQAIGQALRDRVPEDTIASRIKGVLTGKVSRSGLARALGDLEIDEMRRLFIGGDPGNPAPDSLIGRYLAETGAATLVRSFPKTPGGSEMGEPRLVVSVSEKSFGVFKRLFWRPEIVHHVGHASMIQGGAYFSHYPGRSEMILPGRMFTILPTVLLKTSEAQRLAQYFVGVLRYPGGWENPVKVPWQLEAKDCEGRYCATGGYTCCTHWIGNIPIGDELVSSYAFPKNLDYGYDATSSKRTWVTRKLKPYKTEGLDPVIERIWTVPGHGPYSAVVGAEESNRRAEWASPGWVMQTLISSADPSRVPVIFVVMEDHEAPIPEDFAPVYERPY